MKILKSLLIAFSLYSRIPMPQFEWQEDEYGHAISFLPVVGLVIGAAEIGMWKLCLYMGAPVFIKAAALCLVPLVITGGFHLDGYMDVCDALSSYSDPERSLEIMKDPHIGAFAVIGLLRFGLLFLTGAYLLVYGNGEVPVYMFALLFVFVRALCGVMSLVLPKAKKDGMLAVETGRGGSVDFTFLTFQAAASGVFIIYMNLVAGAIVFAVLLCFCFYYSYLCKKKFGGVTGDTAGMFIVRGELLGLLVLAVYFLVV